MNAQLHPLEVNSPTGEPFLRLNYHKNIIITPHRPSDILCYPPIFNDPRVSEWVLNPPIPYLPEHAESWFALVEGRTKALLSKLEAAKDAKDLILVDQCPVRAIREVTAEGEEVYLGDIGIQRCTDGKLLAILAGIQANAEESAIFERENSTRSLGDPEIVWDIGDYLKPSHHGQGIMTDAIGTLLWRWAVPRMGVRRVLATVFDGNHGSTKVLQKNGFVLTKMLENHCVVRGKIRDVLLLEWGFNAVNKKPDDETVGANER